MKKLFLLVAFTGIVGASSASSIVALTKGTVITVGGDEKKDEKKKCEKGKACCKKDAKAGEEKVEGKTCSHDGKKACCKGKAEESKTPATPATK
jgi:hypothetical protein